MAFELTPKCIVDWVACILSWLAVIGLPADRLNGIKTDLCRQWLFSPDRRWPFLSMGFFSPSQPLVTLAAEFRFCGVTVHTMGRQ